MILPPKEERKSWICYEPHKRVRLPDRDDYSLFKGNVDGRDCIKTANGYVVEYFSGGIPEGKLSEWDAASMRLYHTHMNAYYNHKLMHPEYYKQTYEEANMTHKFAYRGFNWHRPVDFYSNWFGCSVYEPDLIFTRDQKKIVMSLQGMAMPKPTRDEDWALIKAGAAKYIGFSENGKVMYESWSGNLPSNEFIENFIQ